MGSHPSELGWRRAIRPLDPNHRPWPGEEITSAIAARASVQGVPRRALAQGLLKGRVAAAPRSGYRREGTQQSSAVRARRSGQVPWETWVPGPKLEARRQAHPCFQPLSALARPGPPWPAHSPCQRQGYPSVFTRNAPRASAGTGPARERTAPTYPAVVAAPCPPT